MEKQTFKSIDEYINLFPKTTQVLLEQVRKVIQEHAPEASEAISYQMPTFKLNGNLVHFAAYQHHIGFYPGAAGIEAFKEDFESYKWSKGAVQFPINKPLPLDLIRRMVQFRVNQNILKLQAKTSKKLKSD